VRIREILNLNVAKILCHVAPHVGLRSHMRRSVEQVVAGGLKQVKPSPTEESVEGASVEERFKVPLYETFSSFLTLIFTFRSDFLRCFFLRVFRLNSKRFYRVVSLCCVDFLAFCLKAKLTFLATPDCSRSVVLEDGNFWPPF
jgi:hypothetical protein